MDVLAVELLTPSRFCVYIDHPEGVDHGLCERVTHVPQTDDSQCTTCHSEAVGSLSPIKARHEVYALTRISSLGSLVGATVFVPSLWLLRAPPPFVAAAAFMWALIVVKHRGNIARLLRRAENKV